MEENYKTTNPERAELQAIYLRLSDLLGKIRTIDARLKSSIQYMEYIAGGLDVLVSYADFLAENISTKSQKGIGQSGGFSISPIEQLPTFKEFRKMKEENYEDETPF
ncbi:MAG: hypothetical protein KF763_13055 [Cyclobacteriaceae bacterium]|nr:hypothetical protein [Cyclobacteriaceae bacterium]